MKTGRESGRWRGGGRGVRRGGGAVGLTAAFPSSAFAARIKSHEPKRPRYVSSGRDSWK